MINILFLLCCLVTSSTSQRADGMQGWQENLTPVKSIQKEFGHVVDCIDINKQPAFNHHLLKNHKLQEKPSNQKVIEKSNLRNSLFGLETPCPKGTVPIRRNTKNDLIQAKSLLNNDILASAPTPTPQDLGKGDHVAEVHLKPQRTYYGVNGVVSIWNPEVEKDQSSAALVWVRHGDNEIAVGWHVSLF
ncbi:uncharacterized protein LOC130715327 [Lotus japonicus]|uniref:uncharacterized protein LOC130715327 n=1 Tax=Lotus japonicus TaxID=34305 RepID=UPI00259023B0|nr:uncharacterized protein LOC130715327 [Lotus japonicus]